MAVSTQAAPPQWPWACAAGERRKEIEDCVGKEKRDVLYLGFFIPNGYAVQLVDLLDSPRLFDSGSHVIPLLTTASDHRF
jgi:hypothetical protein